MTSTTTGTGTYAEHVRRQQPTYEGLSAEDVRARLRNLARFVEYALSAVNVQDVERARDAVLSAQAELSEVGVALEQARPAEELTFDAKEARRIGQEWQPVQGVVDGPPVEDNTWTDPVTVAAGDLAAMTFGWSSVQRQAPAEALRACAQLARQQPQRVPDLMLAAERAHTQIRAALIRAGALPEELR